MYTRKLWRLNHVAPTLFGSLKYRARRLAKSATFCDQQEKRDNRLKSEQLYARPAEQTVHNYHLQRSVEFLENLDDEGLARMGEIQKMIDNKRLRNEQVPDEISPPQWKFLLTECHSDTKRTRYLEKLWLDQIKRHRDVLKKQEKKKLKEEAMKVKDNNDLQRVSVHIPARDENTKSWGNIRALNSDIKIVYDLDYDSSLRESTEVFNQMQLVYTKNRNHLQPLQIHLTSLHRNERLNDLLKHSMAPFFGHEAKFQDVFLGENLVYLTPDGPPIIHFDTKCTYVVGGLVDKKYRPKCSYLKAENLNIRTGSFPLNRYINFSNCDRAKYIFTLDNVHSLMMDMYLYQSWEIALKRNLGSKYLFWTDEISGENAALREKWALNNLQRRRKKSRQIKRDW